MNLKRQIGTLLALAAGSLALAAPAMSATQDPMLDAHDRGVAAAVSATPDRMLDAHDRGTASHEAAVAYFRANEIATRPAPSRTHTFSEYLDGPQRGGASQTGSSHTVVIPEDGFDWRAAAIGASSALMLFLVAVLGVTAVRHSGARPLAR